MDRKEKINSNVDFYHQMLNKSALARSKAPSQHNTIDLLNVWLHRRIAAFLRWYTHTTPISIYFCGIRTKIDDVVAIMNDIRAAKINNDRKIHNF